MPRDNFGEWPPHWGQHKRGSHTVGRQIRSSLMVAKAGASAIALFAATSALSQTKQEDATPPADRGSGLDEIVVTADRANSFGADFVQAGTFRGAKQIDTPLTVTVIPEAVLRAQQANGLFDALRNSAGVVASQIAPNVYSNLTIRGITVENRGNYRLNGALPIINLIDIPLENKFRVEALKGASSLYYGFTTPGGLINLTSKRPTRDLAGSARMAFNGYGQAVASGDVSDTLGPVGIRLTAATGSQKNGIDKVDGVRYFGAAAIDLNPLPGLTIQFDAEHIYKSISEPTQLSLPATATTLPVLLSASANLGDTWLYSTSEETNLLLHANYKIADWLAISGDVGQSRLTRDRHYSTFTFCTAVSATCPAGYAAGDAGTVSVTQSNMLYYRNQMLRAELAASFTTGPLKHSLVIGYSKNLRLAQVPLTSNTAATNFLGTVNFAQSYTNPVRLPSQPLPPRVLATFTSIEDNGYYVFDRADFGSWLQVLGGVRLADYNEFNEITQARTFHVTPTTLSGSVIVKPKSWVSVYASYIEGLETTALAPATAANPFAQLPASPSTQYEAGIKIEPIKSFLLTGSYFSIDRSSASVNPLTNIYEFIGEARFQGVELSASGEVTPDLSIYLTALFLDPKQRQSGTPSLVGKVIENTPRQTWSAFAEYRLPFASGFAISGGAYFIGSRYNNAANAILVPSYTTFDLGGSYTTKLGGADVVFRVNADNVTNEQYWAATGSSLLSQGLPSSIKFSVETKF